MSRRKNSYKKFRKRGKNHQNRWKQYHDTNEASYDWNHSYEYKSNRRYLWLRFIGFFVLMAILFLITGGVISYLFDVENLPANIVEHPSFGFLRCLGPLFFISGLFWIGSWSYRRMGEPIANFMTATEAVAEGDFSVRLPEHGPRQMQQVITSFNEMVKDLAKAEQQRKNLTADIAHELRTPLHILRGNLEGIMDGIYEATPSQLESMLQEIQILSRLVDDLQTISLAEAGQLTLFITQVNVGELLTDVHTSFIQQAQEVGILLYIDIPDSPLMIEADPQRLDQVLGNLVSNALRYTKKGQSISLNAKKLSDDQIQLQIIDEGQGIPADELPFIFDRFYRTDKSRTRKEGGSGLGLTIVRQLVELHNGSINVKSEWGKGSEFSIELPIHHTSSSSS